MLERTRSEIDSDNQREVDDSKQATWQRFRGNDFSRLTEDQNDSRHGSSVLPVIFENFKANSPKFGGSPDDSVGSDLVIKEEDPLEIL